MTSGSAGLRSLAGTPTRSSANGGPCASETGIENPDLSPAQRAILKAPGGPKLFAYLREVEDATGMVAEWDPHADIGVCAWCHAPYISDVDECNDVCGSVWAENETIPTGLVSVPGWWNPPADYDPSGTDPVQKQDPELMSGPSIGTPSPGGAGLVGLAALAALFYFGAVKR